MTLINCLGFPLLTRYGVCTSITISGDFNQGKCLVLYRSLYSIALYMRPTAGCLMENTPPPDSEPSVVFSEDFVLVTDHVRCFINEHSFCRLQSTFTGGLVYDAGIVSWIVATMQVSDPRPWEPEHVPNVVVDDTVHLDQKWRTEIVWVEEDLEHDIDMALNKAFGPQVVRTHCRSASDAKRLEAEFSPLALHDYLSLLHRFRVIREQGRIILQSGNAHALRRDHRDKIQRDAAAKKKEQERKSVPKQERMDERKKKRAIKEQLDDVELQGARHIVGGVLAAVFGGLTARFLSKGASAADSIKVFLDGLMSAKKQLMRLMGFLWFIPLVLVLHYFLGEWKLPFVTSAVVAFLPKFLPKGIWDRITTIFSSGDVQTQVGFSGYGNLIAVLFAASVFRGRVTDAKVSEFNKRVGFMPKAAQGWESLITFAMNGIEKLVNFVRKQFGREAIELYHRPDRVVHEWAKRAEVFLRDDAVGKEMDQNKLDSLLDCLQEGYGFKEVYRGTEAGKLVDITVSRLGAMTVPHLGAIASRNNTRFEPVTVFLYGAPGVGKTLMAVAFVTALLLKSELIEKPYTPDMVTSQMWQKGTSEYWQGYNRQKAIIMDDAFQNRAFAGDKDNDYFNIIKMVGCFSMPLNFADLASKGKIFFGSQLVFGSTNLSSINAEAGIVIQEPEAVARRIHFGYQLFVNPQYQLNGKLDYSKFVIERQRCLNSFQAGSDPLLAFPWYIWSVERHDFMRGTNHGESMPLIEAIGVICAEIRERMASHTVAQQSLNAMITAFGAMPHVEAQAGRQLPKLNEVFRASHLMSLVRAARAEFFSDCSCVQKLGTVAAFAAGGFVAFKLIETILRGLCGLVSGMFSRKAVAPQSNRPLTRPAKFYRKQIVTQAGQEYTATDFAYSNSYKMFNDSTGMIYGQVLFVCHEMALQPQHFTEAMRAHVESGVASLDDTLCFRNCLNSENVHTMSIAKYLGFERVSDPDNDVEFVRFTNILAQKSIITMFLKQSDLKHTHSCTVELHLCEIDDRKRRLPDNKHMCYTYPHVGYDGIEGLSGKPLRFAATRQMNRYFTYPSARDTGDCGAILALQNSKLFGGRAIMGVHCAGTVRSVGGYANVVTEEMIRKAMATLYVIDDKYAEDATKRKIVTQCGDAAPFVEMGSFMPLYTVDMPVSFCPFSKYKKTNFHDPTKYDHEPAVLGSVVRDGVRIWPMEQAVKPYSTPVLHHEIDCLPHAVYTAFRPLYEATDKLHRRLYSFDEAVIGIPHEKFRAIPRNTAPGFPYVCAKRDKSGKKDFFGDGVDYDLTSAECAVLRERVSEVLHEARKGVRLSHTYVDFLKDELRPKAKIEAVATRLISSAPLDYVVAWRMLFGSFSSAVMRNNVETGMAPGICCYSDWPRIARWLQSKGSKVFDGDFKAFDSSEQPCVHEAILDEINRWYNDSAENQLARRVLWMDLVHSRHVGGIGDSKRYIYQWAKSLPSGHPFTTIVNSLYSLICLIVCYISLTGDMCGFWRLVAPLTYGDDNVVNVHDSVVALYNQKTVSAKMKELFGMTYTSGSKTGDLVEYTDLESVTFLKRRFFCDEKGWLCPLELSSFLYTHYWCKNPLLKDAILKDNIENALEELSLHPQDVWDKHHGDLVDGLMSEYGIATKARPDRASYLSLVLKRTEEWY